MTGSPPVGHVVPPVIGPEPIPESYRRLFDALLRAADDSALALLECRDVVTGTPRYVICAVLHDDDEVVMIPFGHLCADPHEAYLPPGAAATR